MSANTRRVVLITSCWVAISLLLFSYAHFYLVVSTPGAAAAPEYRPHYNLIAYVAASLFGGLFFGYAMVFRSPRRTQRRSFSYGILYNSGLFVVLYVTAVSFVTVPIALFAEPEASLASVARVAWGVLTNAGTLITMLIWALIVAATQFTLQVSDKFGQGVLWQFITGRYFRPKEEDRIFMFLDLASSTTIAERLGHAGYFEFIRECIADVTEPILANEGEIYQYVGDEVVVTWKINGPADNARCVACYFAIQRHLDGLAAGYRERFGVAPRFKAGLHSGRVMVGEIGIVRKDIVFSGDVLNTTARIQAECNRRGTLLLASSAVVASMRCDQSWIIRSLGEMQLRGKHESVELMEIQSPLPGPAAGALRR